MQGRTDDVVTHITEFVRLVPDDAPGHAELAENLLKQKKAALAVSISAKPCACVPRLP